MIVKTKAGLKAPYLMDGAAAGVFVKKNLYKLKLGKR